MSFRAELEDIVKDRPEVLPQGLSEWERSERINQMTARDKVLLRHAEYAQLLDILKKIAAGRRAALQDSQKEILLAAPGLIELIAQDSDELSEAHKKGLQRPEGEGVSGPLRDFIEALHPGIGEDDVILPNDRGEESKFYYRYRKEAEALRKKVIPLISDLCGELGFPKERAHP